MYRRCTAGLKEAKKLNENATASGAYRRGGELPESGRVRRASDRAKVFGIRDCGPERAPLRWGGVSAPKRRTFEEELALFESEARAAADRRVQSAMGDDRAA